MSKFVKTVTLEEAARVDVASSTIVYIGKSAPGTLPSEGAWKISRATTDSLGNLVLQFANGSSYVSVWDDRASLTYT